MNSIKLKSILSIYEKVQLMTLEELPVLTQRDKYPNIIGFSRTCLINAEEIKCEGGTRVEHDRCHFYRGLILNPVVRLLQPGAWRWRTFCARQEVRQILPRYQLCSFNLLQLLHDILRLALVLLFDD